jgi:hypothetical protein
MLAQDIVIERWTPELLLLVWGFLQSIILEYLPGVAPWYHKKEPQWKRFIQLIGLAFVSVLVVVLACTDVLGGIACSRGGVIDVVVVFLLSLTTNQTTHLIFKKNGS